MGDFHAQIAGGAVGGERLARVHGRVRPRAARAARRRDHRRTERAMREAIRAPPARRVRVRDHLGRLRRADHHPVRCEVRGDELLIDYTGSSPESRRGINVVMNYTEAYTTYGVKVIVSPDVPNNEGAFRPIRITAPEGSILNARHPAPVAARHVDRPLPAPRHRGRAQGGAARARDGGGLGEHLGRAGRRQGRWSAGRSRYVVLHLGRHRRARHQGRARRRPRSRRACSALRSRSSSPSRR